MSCEICGRDITGRGYKVRIEGAVLLVCRQCSEMGEPVREDREKRSVIDRRSGSQGNISRSKDERGAGSPKPFPGTRPRKQSAPVVVEIVDDYPRVVKAARGKRTLEEFSAMIKEKVSTIQKIENGKMKPTIQLAKKIEGMFHVKLIEKREEAEDLDDAVWKQDKKNRFVPSLGDFMKQDDKE